MTRNTRLTVLLLAFLAAAVIGAIPLLPSNPLFTLITLFGGFGLGAMSMAFLLAPRSSRIRRPRERSTASRSTARKKPAARKSGGDARGPARKKARSRKGGNDKTHSDAPKISGTVKWFSDKKGFGFITPENGDEDCFVHRSAVQGNGSLNEGNRVEFQIVSDDKGRRAAANVVTLG